MILDRLWRGQPIFSAPSAPSRFLPVVICSFCLPSDRGTATMWIQVRTMDGKETHRVDSLSKLTKVEELRQKIHEVFHVTPDRQRLFYRGKQVLMSCSLSVPQRYFLDVLTLPNLPLLKLCAWCDVKQMGKTRNFQ